MSPSVTSTQVSNPSRAGDSTAALGSLICGVPEPVFWEGFRSPGTKVPSQDLALAPDPGRNRIPSRPSCNSLLMRECEYWYTNISFFKQKGSEQLMGERKNSSTFHRMLEAEEKEPEMERFQTAWFK